MRGVLIISVLLACLPAFGQERGAAKVEFRVTRFDPADREAPVFQVGPLEKQVVAKVGSPVSGEYGLSVRASVAEFPEETQVTLPKIDVKELETPDQSVRWISDGDENGRIEIRTEKTQGMVGTIDGQDFQSDELSIGDVAIDGINYGTIVATTQDDQPLDRSDNIVLLASSHSENQEMGWNEARNSVGREWGRGPTTIAAVTATVRLKTMQPLRVYALDGKGLPKHELDTSFADGQLEFKLTADDQTLWYGLMKENGGE